MISSSTLPVNDSKGVGFAMFHGILHIPNLGLFFYKHQTEDLSVWLEMQIYPLLLEKQIHVPIDRG